MANSPGPWFTKIEYHSTVGSHVMILPMNDVDLNEGSPELSNVIAWDASTILWTDMVTNLCGQMASKFPTSHNFDVATLFSQPDPELPPVYHVTFTVNVPGTNALSGWYVAAQETINARDTEGNLVKLVLLDFASTNVWSKFKSVADADINDLFAEWTALSNGWASRAGNRPNTFISSTRTLNEKLRREYKLT
jgi:hypothetical protein